MESITIMDLTDRDKKRETDQRAAKHEAAKLLQPLAPEFPWITRPADPVPMKDLRQIEKSANAYFTRAWELGLSPTLSGLSLALGVSGPTALQRLAQRRPELRWLVSRCLTAVAHGYESAIAAGGPAQGAIFMLKHLPEFDPEEPAGSKPVQYWTDKRELIINARVHGVRRPEDEGADLTPREAYLKVIHGDIEDMEDAIYEDIPDAPGPRVSSLEELLSDPAPIIVEEKPRET